MVMEVLGAMEKVIPIIGSVAGDLGSCGTKTIVKEAVVRLTPEGLNTVKTIGAKAGKVLIPMAASHMVVKELKEMTNETVEGVKTIKKFFTKPDAAPEEQVTEEVEAELVEQN